VPIRTKVQEAQLPLRKQGVSFVLSSHYTLGNLAFWVSLYVTREIFLENLHSNGRMRVYENSTHGSLKYLS